MQFDSAIVHRMFPGSLKKEIMNGVKQIFISYRVSDAKYVPLYAGSTRVCSSSTSYRYTTLSMRHSSPSWSGRPSPTLCSPTSPPFQSSARTFTRTTASIANSKPMRTLTLLSRPSFCLSNSRNRRPSSSKTPMGTSTTATASTFRQKARFRSTTRRRTRSRASIFRSSSRRRPARQWAKADKSTR